MCSNRNCLREWKVQQQQTITVVRNTSEIAYYWKSVPSAEKVVLKQNLVSVLIKSRHTKAYMYVQLRESVLGQTEYLRNLWSSAHRFGLFF